MSVGFATRNDTFYSFLLNIGLASRLAHQPLHRQRQQKLKTGDMMGRRHPRREPPSPHALSSLFWRRRNIRLWLDHRPEMIHSGASLSNTTLGQGLRRLLPTGGCAQRDDHSFVAPSSAVHVVPPPVSAEPIGSDRA